MSGTIRGKRSLQRFGRGFGNPYLLTRAFLAFIVTVVFLLLSFKASVVLNCNGFVYFKVIQWWFLSNSGPED